MSSSSPIVETYCHVSSVAPSDVRNVAIIGTGVIGSGWAAVFQARGYTVTAYVRSAESEAKFRSFLQDAWAKVLERGLTSDVNGWKAVKCVRTIKECVQKADYVQESVVEELKLKQDILQEIDMHAPMSTLVGTSSSFIPLSLARFHASTKPSRIATAHPTLPQWDSFVEVLGATADHTAWLAAFFRRVGMDVVSLRKESHGHALNALLSSISMRAGSLVQTGTCSAEDLDVALSHLARLILMGGGMSGCMVGMVGGGEPHATTAVATDMAIGAPMAGTAAMASWLLPPGMAWLILWSMQLWRWVTQRAAVKAAVRCGINWWMAPFYERWQTCKAGFEARALRRAHALDAIG